ncbi:MAG: methyltransferase domain-containing protein [Candidatus Cryosericum sp.]
METNDWTQNYFDEVYRRLFLETVDPARTAYQVRGLLRMCPLLPGASVLDVGCGVGRHGLALAGLGFHVIGIDSNPDYILECRNRAAAQGVSADFFAMDSRTMSLDRRVDLAISLWSSFGYYGETGDVQVLERIADHLRSGGRLVIDVENRDYIVKHFVPQEWHEHGDEVVLESRRFDPINGTVSTRRVVVSGVERHEYRRVLRMYTGNELSVLLRRAGLRIERWYGDYDGSRLGSDSRRMIAVAVR